MKLNKKYSNLIKNLPNILLIICILVFIAYILNLYLSRTIIEGIGESLTDEVNKSKDSENKSIVSTVKSRHKDEKQYKSFNVEPFNNKCPNRHSSGVNNNDSLNSNCKIMKKLGDKSDNPITI